MATKGLWTRSLTSRHWVTSWWGTLPLPAFLFVFLLFSFLGVSGDQLSTLWWWKAPVQRTPPGKPLGNLRRPWACPLHGHWLLWCWTTWAFPLIILIFHVWLVVVDPYFIYHEESFEKTSWICLENTKLFHRCVVVAPFTLSQKSFGTQQSNTLGIWSALWMAISKRSLEMASSLAL